MYYHKNGRFLQRTSLLSVGLLIIGGLSRSYQRGISLMKSGRLSPDGNVRKKQFKME